MMRAAGEKPILLTAPVGSALVQEGQQETIEEQFDNLRVPVRHTARLSKDYRIIITDAGEEAGLFFST
jgi:carbamate kinase